MRLCSIASGSSGNCIYVGSDTTHLLVAVGISGRKTEEGLHELGLSGEDIHGILVTHEHSDHIGGIGVMARKRGIPIYATAGTIEAMKRANTLGKAEDSLFHEIRADESFYIGDIMVDATKISHDAAEPVAYRFRYENRRVAVCTDLGTFDDYIVEKMRGMDAILIESNHDVRMLQVGPYPYYLKKRILGDRGHLSNENSGRLLSRLLHDNMKQIILGHLSRENNLPELAYETVRIEIENGDNPYHADDFPIQVARRSEVSPVITV